ncbi:Uncharacterized protein dnm_048980 [Desulfonema magnum]|uniref:Uncharacterized protein n=1 Tax=Desulfonema magnum TaxID=45655 RepID=A0A975BNR0_9BACT|nr:Uncharacterized protein dnm_048980 [Desulfonema magnum]
MRICVLLKITGEKKDDKTDNELGKTDNSISDNHLRTDYSGYGAQC